MQLEAATVGYVAASTPLLVVASLAGCDVVDTTTIKYLLQYALRKRQKEEEEERRKKEEKEKEEAQRALDDFFSSPWAQNAAARGSQERKEEKRRRKKKKRRKKKTPKTSSSACRMVRQPWRCHKLYGVLVLGSEHSANFVLDCACSWSYGVTVATFIWTFLLSTMLAGFAGDDAPRAVFPSFLLVQHIVETPQLQFICVVVDLPVVAHMLSLMVQTARRTIEIPQLLVYKVVNVPVFRDVQVPRVRRGEAAR